MSVRNSGNVCKLENFRMELDWVLFYLQLFAKSVIQNTYVCTYFLRIQGNRDTGKQLYVTGKVKRDLRVEKIYLYFFDDSYSRQHALSNATNRGFLTASVLSLISFKICTFVKKKCKKESNVTTFSQLIQFA